jgi:Tol biopolymer transport system component
MYILNADGSGMQKISHDKGFDAFPMISPDGKKILFSSNRNNGGTRDTNVFVADWVPGSTAFKVSKGSRLQ